MDLNDIPQLSTPGIDAVTNEVLKSHRSDIDDLKIGQRNIIERMDEKVNKSELNSLTMGLEKIAISLEDARKERKSDWKLMIGIGVTVIIAISGGLTTLLWSIYSLSNDTKLRVTILEEKFKSLNLVD
jgi:hypothetical protein